VQTQRSVRAHTRKDDADAALLLVVGQRTEKEIDRQAQAARHNRIEQVQHSVQDGHVLVGRDDVDAVPFDARPILYLYNGHGGAALEQLHHHVLVRRVKVLNDHKRHAAVFGHIGEERFQRLKPPGRGADADDGKGAARLARRCRHRGGRFFRHGADRS
jgi:hypothetical protein